MKIEVGAYEAQTKLPELLRQVQEGKRFTISNQGGGEAAHGNIIIACPHHSIRYSAEKSMSSAVKTVLIVSVAAIALSGAGFAIAQNDPKIGTTVSDPPGPL